MSPPEPSPAAEPGFWTRLDRRIFRIESAVAVAAMAVMTAVVFLAVVWRILAAPEGRIEAALRALTGSDAPWLATAGDVIALVLWTLACVLAVRSARPQASWRRALAVGGGIGAGSAAAAVLFVVALPAGLVWAQRLALALLLWVVLLGSSMAAHTRRHIFLQAAQKLVPPRLAAAHASVSLLLAAAFTVFLAWVGGAYAARNFRYWIDTDFAAGIFDSLPLPYWTVTIAIPIGFGLTVARFVGQAIAIWRGVLPPVPPAEEIEAARASDLASHEEAPVEGSAGAAAAALDAPPRPEAALAAEEHAP